MDDRLTEFLAVIGASTGSVALGWDVYKWRHTAPQLKVSVNPNMSMVVGPSVQSGKYFLVRVANAGRQKTTLTTLAIRAYPSRWKALRKRDVSMFIVPSPHPKPLPHVLDVGESWEATPIQDPKVQPFLETGVVEFLVYHALSEKPAVCRVRFPQRQHRNAAA